VLFSKSAMQEQNPSLVAHPSLIFATDAIESLWKTIKERGVEVTEILPVPYGKMFSFKDTDGNSYLVRG
jgi:lactoylglutathione lyase